MVVYWACVSEFTATTLALATTAPTGSVTVPVMLPRFVCAKAATANRAAPTRARLSFHLILTALLLSSVQSAGVRTLLLPPHGRLWGPWLRPLQVLFVRLWTQLLLQKVVVFLEQRRVPRPAVNVG